MADVNTDCEIRDMCLRMTEHWYGFGCKGVLVSHGVLRHGRCLSLSLYVERRIDAHAGVACLRWIVLSTFTCYCVDRPPTTQGITWLFSNATLRAPVTEITVRVFMFYFS